MNTKNLLPLLFAAVVFTTGCTKTETCYDVPFVNVYGETGFRYGPDDNPSTDAIEGQRFESLKAQNQYRTFIWPQARDAMLGWEVHAKITNKHKHNERKR